MFSVSSRFITPENDSYFRVYAVGATKERDLIYFREENR
jgi:hypothetical protein